MSSTQTVLELQHISKSFPGVKALDDVNFSLKEGTVHVLCGENGAGKSTLMKIIDGIYQADEGDLFLNGNKVQIKSPIQAKANGIAMIFQELSYVPDMTLEEQIEISKIQSVAGNLSGSLVKTRPVRSPHHTATVSAMIGGGFNPKPGEITQAHGGILFLDELPEFSRQVIETLRQPLEDEKIIVSRSGGTYEFPAKFILIGAMNPCKCGYYPDMNKCTCTEQEVKKYMEKISGPLIDRIDLCVHMNQVTYFQLEKEEQPEDSLTIKERVNRAVQIQRERYANEKFKFNSQLSGENIKKYCKLNKEEQHLMEKIYTTMDLSIRAYDKIIKVARTIADLKQHEKIQQGDIAEAVSYRPVLFK